MIDTPEILETEEQTIAFIPITVAREQIQEVMGAGLQELTATLEKQGIAATGAWFTHHLRRPSDIFDFEICLPVASAVAPEGRVQAGRAPAMKAARTIYRGGYHGLSGAWQEFGAWLESQGLTPAVDLYERYLSGPDSSTNPADWRTELKRPLISETR